MKKITKTMMMMGALSAICGVGAYMYKNNNKKTLKKYKAYLEN